MNTGWATTVFHGRCSLCEIENIDTTYGENTGRSAIGLETGGKQWSGSAHRIAFQWRTVRAARCERRWGSWNMLPYWSQYICIGGDLLANLFWQEKLEDHCEIQTAVSETAAGSKLAWSDVSKFIFHSLLNLIFISVGIPECALLPWLLEVEKRHIKTVIESTSGKLSSMADKTEDKIILHIKHPLSDKQFLVWECYLLPVYDWERKGVFFMRNWGD